MSSILSSVELTQAHFLYCIMAIFVAGVVRGFSGFAVSGYKCYEFCILEMSQNVQTMRSVSGESVLEFRFASFFLYGPSGFSDPRVG